MKDSPISHLLLALVCSMTALPALAHEGKPHDNKAAANAPKVQKDWGIAGDAKAASRTIEVGMGDNFRFSPEQITVKQGETVRFVIKNTGQQLHEFVIGSKKENNAHAAMMLKFPNMAHEEPYMAHVAPAKTGEIIWTFNRSGEFEFACLIAGHYQAGMLGRIQVAAKN